MAKRKVLKLTPVLVTLNILVLLIIVAFYTTRLIKYYLLENGPVDEDTVILLVDEIKKKQSYLDETKGLVLDEESNMYRYKGEVDDNYVLYSGMLYRIVAIDNENNIRLVSEDNITLLYPGLNNGYEKSFVNKWLNKSDEEHSGIYEDELINSDGLLTETYMCSDAIDDVSNITCDNYYMEKKITLLSLHDYKEAGGKNSYLNNGEMYYFGTLNSTNQQYFITEDGEIALNKKSSKVISVKPVITLNSETPLIEGNGKKDNPYIIEKHEVKNSGNLYINDIVKLNDLKYKVVEVNADVGIAFDGDADRIGVVDNKGRMITGDKLLLIYASDLINELKIRNEVPVIVSEVKCSQVLYNEIEKMGGCAIMCKTGHGFIKAKMRETGAVLAGEMSGHTFFKDSYYGFDDAVYAGCRIIEIIANKKKQNPEFKDRDMLKPFDNVTISPEIRLNCPNELKKSVLAEVEKYANENIFGSKILDIITLDGLRFVFEDGFALIRQSNTEPVFTLRFEAQTEEKAHKYRDIMIALLDETIKKLVDSEEK